MSGGAFEVMEPDNFFYWLQGYFELLTTDQPDDARVYLTAKQVECVQRHIALVEALLRHRKTVLPENIVRVRTLVDVMAAQPTNSQFFTDQIRRVVHDVFQHVIDPKAGDAEVQAVLDRIHHVPGVDYTKPAMKC